MEKTLDLFITGFASILVFVAVRICYDLVMSLREGFENRLFWLTVTFTSLAMVGAGGLVAVSIVDLPIWLKLGMLITLITASLGLFNTLQGFGK